MIDATRKLAGTLARPRHPRPGDRAIRHAQRQARRQLRRELACYTSPADQRDLDAILARHSEAETAEVRDLLRSIHATSPHGGATAETYS